MKAEKKLRVRNFVWLAIALLILLGLIGISFFKQSRSTRALTHTWEVKNVISNLISSIKDAETGQRGYVITSETDYLAPYHLALTQSDLGIENLKELTKEDTIQQENIKRIDKFINLKFNQLEENIDLVEEGNDMDVVALIKTDLGKKYMDSIRKVSVEMFEREEQQLENRIQNYKNWRLTSIILAILSALLVVYCLIKIYREVYPVFSEIIETRKELHNASANLAETINKLKESQNEKLEEIKEKDIKLQAQTIKIERLEEEVNSLKNKHNT